MQLEGEFYRWAQCTFKMRDFWQHTKSELFTYYLLTRYLRISLKSRYPLSLPSDHPIICARPRTLILQIVNLIWRTRRSQGPSRIIYSGLVTSCSGHVTTLPHHVSGHVLSYRQCSVSSHFGVFSCRKRFVWTRCYDQMIRLLWLVLKLGYSPYEGSAASASDHPTC